MYNAVRAPILRGLHIDLEYVLLDFDLNLKTDLGSSREDGEECPN